MVTPRTPTDLISLPPDARVSQPASTFAQHIHDLHAEIRCKIALSSDSYKLSAGVCRKAVNFDVGILSWLVFDLNNSLKTPLKSFTLVPWDLTKSFDNWDLMRMYLISQTVWVLVLF